MRAFRHRGDIFIENNAGRAFKLNSAEGIAFRRRRENQVQDVTNALRAKERAAELEAAKLTEAKASLAVNTPASEPTRMAGDRVEQLLAEYERDLDLESDAIQYLSNKAADLKALGLLNSQQTLAQADAPVQSLQRMNGNVPMPLIKMLPNGEIRKHVEYSVNPVTGVEEVVPYLDPNDSRKALETIYGPAGIDPAAGHQAEPAMMNAMKLQGYDVEYHDPEYAPGRTKGLADLQGARGDELKNVDVMVQVSKDLKIPLYTMLQVPGPKVFKGDINEREVFTQVKNLINNQLNIQGDKDYIKAVETLIGQGKLTPNHNSRAGKLLRADKGFMGDEAYDELLVPSFNKTAMAEKSDSPDSPQNKPIAPESIQKVNLTKTLNQLKSGEGRNASIIPNYGARKARNKSERAQVKVSIPMTKAYGVEDATIDDPLLQQLLSLSAMRARLV